MPSLERARMGKRDVRAMTRDEYRGIIIAAMKKGARAAGHTGLDGDIGTELFTAAFDALHGIAFVDPVEATEEMLDAVYDYNAPECSPCGEDWRIMASRGDLTNPPEGKP